MNDNGIKASQKTYGAYATSLASIAGIQNKATFQNTARRASISGMAALGNLLFLFFFYFYFLKIYIFVFIFLHMCFCAFLSVLCA